MATFTKTVLVALALASTAIGGALAQQADQATPAPAQPAPVRSRIATRQILLEPTAPVQVAAATTTTPDTAPAQAATPAQAAAAPAAAAPQVAVQAEAVPNQAAPAPAPQVVQPNGAPVDPGIVVRKRIEREQYGYGGYSNRYADGYGYAPRYRAHYDHCR